MWSLVNTVESLGLQAHLVIHSIIIIGLDFKCLSLQLHQLNIFTIWLVVCKIYLMCFLFWGEYTPFFIFLLNIPQTQSFVVYVIQSGKRLFLIVNLLNYGSPPISLCLNNFQGRILHTPLLNSHSQHTFICQLSTCLVFHEKQ